MDNGYLDTFLARIVKPDDPGGCWEFDGAHSGGYSETWDGQRKLYGHRVSYEIWVGPIPDGLTIDHLCRNRGCVNPGHLEAVTNQTNILRGTSFSAKNARKSHCPRGHPYDDENTYVDRRGYRACRACWTIKNRERRSTCPQGHPLDEVNAELDSLGRRRCKACLPTHCKHGHEFTPENTAIAAKDGSRVCRACKRATYHRAKRQ